MHRLIFPLFLLLFSAAAARAGTTGSSPDCGNAPARAWWDVRHYDLSVDFRMLPSLKGKVTITARVIQAPLDSLQVDLRQPLQIDSVLYMGNQLAYARQGNQYYIRIPSSGYTIGDTFSFALYYHGTPALAEHAPWDSGLVGSRDAAGNPWWAVTCESDGAYVWFPCKNSRSDEAESITTHYTCDARYKAIGNGRLSNKKITADGRAVTWTWTVSNPINNYDITFYLGNYVHWHASFHGRKGLLDLNYYVLPEHLAAAKRQFAIVPKMLQCFEQKLGPYPFYQDGYKLVESPYLGMEHQSAVAYGNRFQMGYLGTDRSHTGIGLTFDFIIVHESAHEWFGNSITASDPAYGWIQEGFTTYAETIFVGCLTGKEKAFAYQRGKRANILNDRPVAGVPGTCDEGSTDQYDKAAFMIHMIRVLMDNDNRFFDLLRAMNQAFYHEIITGIELEKWMEQASGIPLQDIFAQYLHRRELPVLAFKKDSTGKLMCRWEQCTKGFRMPVKWQRKNQEAWLHPTPQWQYVTRSGLTRKEQISPDFLIRIDWR